MDDIKIAVEPKVPTVETLTADLNKALSQFAFTYLRLGDLMNHTQTMLRGARKMGASGDQVAVLAVDLDAVQKAFNMSVPVFSKGALPEVEQQAVNQMIEVIKSMKKPEPKQ